MALAIFTSLLKNKGRPPRIIQCKTAASMIVTDMRGLETAEAAQELMDAMRIHYNFIRPNQAIGGQTPAEAAGISLNLRENKVESLMCQAAIHSKDAKSEPVIKGLGIRINKVQILNEKDSIKVVLKGWQDLKVWLEIHDILRVQGFSWLSNGKDSCGIKMTQKRC